MKITKDKSDNRKWVGLHDHANFSGKWLDEVQPYSWLRAFELAAKRGIDTRAILAEKYENYSMNCRIRGVLYDFYTKDKRFDSMVDHVLGLEPSVFFINVCWYESIADNLEFLRSSLVETKFIIRIHHDVHYLEKQNKFIDVVMLCDHAIVSTENQKKRLIDLGFKNGISVLPFGVNSKEFSNNKSFSDRETDLVSFANSHPARNRKLVEKVYARLGKRGFKVKNVIGLSRTELAETLSDSKFMLLSSMTEASGSRIMLEAIAAGCIPIAFKECGTAVEVLNEHGGGEVVETGLVLKLPEKKVKRTMGVEKKIERRLHEVLTSQPNPCPGGLKSNYEFQNEVEEIYKIIERFGS